MELRLLPAGEGTRRGGDAERGAGINPGVNPSSRPVNPLHLRSASEFDTGD